MEKYLNLRVNDPSYDKWEAENSNLDRPDAAKFSLKLAMKS
jgi:hypothetical protein